MTRDAINKAFLMWNKKNDVTKQIELNAYVFFIQFLRDILNFYVQSIYGIEYDSGAVPVLFGSSIYSRIGTSSKTDFNSGSLLGSVMVRDLF